jgi:hypothetical protein
MVYEGKDFNHHLFPTELILQREARSDDTDKLSADFMPRRRNHLVRAFPDNTVIDISIHATLLDHGPGVITSILC